MAARRTRRRPRPTPSTEEVLDRIVEAYHAARGRLRGARAAGVGGDRVTAAPAGTSARWADRAPVGRSASAPARWRACRNLYGYPVDEERAVATVEAVLRRPADQLHRHLQRLRRGRHGRAPHRHRDPPRAAACRPASCSHQGRPRPADRRLLRRPGARLASRRASSGSASTASRCCTCTTPSGSPFEEATAPGGPVDALVDAARARARRPPRRGRRPGRR